MSFLEAKDSLLGFLISGAVLAIAYYLRNMSTSIMDLNSKIGLILIHIQYHKEELDDHGDRLRKLEDYKDTN